MVIVNLIIGSIMLLLGRKIYFLFVGGVGFIAGVNLAMSIIPNSSPLVMILIGLTAGMIGAMFAIFLQRFTLVVAGAYSGIFLIQFFLSYLPTRLGIPGWGFLLIGALLGAVLMWVFFDWAIIVLSSLSGAVLIISSFNFTAVTVMVSIIILTAIGIFIQSKLLSSSS